MLDIFMQSRSSKLFWQQRVDPTKRTCQQKFVDLFDPSNIITPSLWMEFTGIKRMALGALILAYIGMSSKSVCTPIFILKVNVHDLIFNVRYQSSTLRSSYVNISQTMTDVTNVIIERYIFDLGPL